MNTDLFDIFFKQNQEMIADLLEKRKNIIYRAYAVFLENFLKQFHHMSCFCLNTNQPGTYDGFWIN